MKKEEKNSENRIEKQKVRIFMFKCSVNSVIGGEKSEK